MSPNIIAGASDPGTSASAPSTLRRHRAGPSASAALEGSLSPIFSESGLKDMLSQSPGPMKIARDWLRRLEISSNIMTYDSPEKIPPQARANCNDPEVGFF